PTRVIAVLRDERLADLLAQAGARAAILADPTGQHRHPVARLVAGSVEPPLDGGGAEAHGSPGDGVPPRPPRQLLERLAELTATGRRRQQRPHDRESQLGPAAR